MRFLKKINSSFVFGKRKEGRLARLHIKKSFSNIFVTMTDLNDLVIFCVSSGSSNNTFSRRKKVSPYAVEFILKRLLNYLRLYKVKVLEVFLKLRISVHIYFFLKELRQNGFYISKIALRSRLPHNGVRSKRKPRK